MARLQRTAEKCGRAFSSVTVIEPEADFPSMDDAPPLKMVASGRLTCPEFHQPFQKASCEGRLKPCFVVF